MNYNLSPEALLAIIVAVLSYILMMFPIVRVKFAPLATEIKSLIVIGLLVFSELVVYVLGATGTVQFYTLAGTLIIWVPFPLLYMLWLFGMMVGVNQGAYKLLSAFEPPDVTRAIAIRDIPVKAIASPVVIPPAAPAGQPKLE